MKREEFNQVTNLIKKVNDKGEVMDILCAVPGLSFLMRIWTDYRD